MGSTLFKRSLASQLSPNSSNPALLSSAYPLNNAIGIRIPPQWSFYVTFLSDTCGNDNDSPLEYSSAGLPSWLSFDPNGPTFAGETPVTAEDANVTLSCTKSNSQVSETFLIRVISQLMLPSVLPPILSAPRNAVRVNTSDAIRSLTLGKTQLSASQKSAAQVVVDSSVGWLNWDPGSLLLSGLIPDDYISLSHATTITIPIAFTVPDTLPANTSLTITIQPYIFTALKLPDHLVSGRFSLSLQPFMRDSAVRLQLSTQPIEAQSWLMLDVTNALLSGSVPEDLSYTHVSVNIEATFIAAPLKASTSFDLLLDASPSPPSDPSLETGHLRKQTTVLVALISTIGILFLFIILVFVATRSFGAGARHQRRRRPFSQLPKSRFIQPSTSGADTEDIPLQSSQRRWWLLGSGSSRARSTSPPQPSPPVAVQVISSPTNTIKSPRRRVTTKKPDPTFLAPPPTQRRWGPEVPRPPPGMTPKETKDWVDKYVCDWAEQYGSSQGRRSPSDWDGMLPSSSRVHPLLPPIAPFTAAAAAHNRSQSYSDASSVASWESLDSWEMERRVHYEEPRRRGDFAEPRSQSLDRRAPSRPSRLSQVVGGDDNELEDMFFPRPLGAETPGAGMARSPHVEALSRFSGTGGGTGL